MGNDEIGVALSILAEEKTLQFSDCQRVTAIAPQEPTATHHRIPAEDVYLDVGDQAGRRFILQKFLKIFFCPHKTDASRRVGPVWVCV
jgi:hypothetical protein